MDNTLTSSPLLAHVFSVVTQGSSSQTALRDNTTNGLAGRVNSELLFARVSCETKIILHCIKLSKSFSFEWCLRKTRFERGEQQLGNGVT